MCSFEVAARQLKAAKLPADKWQLFCKSRGFAFLQKCFSNTQNAKRFEIAMRWQQQRHKTAIAAAI